MKSMPLLPQNCPSAGWWASVMRIRRCNSWQTVVGEDRSPSNRVMDFRIDGVGQHHLKPFVELSDGLANDINDDIQATHAGQERQTT